MGSDPTEETYRRIGDDANDVLAPFVTEGGAVEVPFEVNVVGALRP